MLSSRTYPTSGMTRSGLLFALPTSEPPTSESDCSSLLPTPDASLGNRGNGRSPEALVAGGTDESGKRLDRSTSLSDLPVLLPTPTAVRYGTNQGGASGRTGSIRPSLDTLAPLLPTPRATDGTKGGPNQRGSSGDLMFPSAVQRFTNHSCTLLPTPCANDAKSHRNLTANRSPGKLAKAGTTQTDALVPISGRTKQRSSAGPPSSDGPPLTPQPPDSAAPES